MFLRQNVVFFSRGHRSKFVWSCWKHTKYLLKKIAYIVLPQIGDRVSISQIRIDGSSCPPAEATKRSLGEIPIAATEAWWSWWLPTWLKFVVSQIMTWTYKKILIIHRFYILLYTFKETYVQMRKLKCVMKWIIG